MELPSEVPVMTLPGTTLFPQALLPLYIYEPRYRQMLSDMLSSERMFSVAMQKPGCSRETPCAIAGLVSVGHKDGTSHLILQGLARVELKEPVQYRPYRVHHIRPIQTPLVDNVMVDALLAKILELVGHRIELGGHKLSLPSLESGNPQSKKNSETLKNFSAADVVRYLENLPCAEAVADMVAGAFLTNPLERQAILELFGVEDRLKRLIHFLMAEIKLHQKNKE
jgi:ATP-dependent Lon protease